MNKHYDIPIDFKLLLTGQKLNKIDEASSVIKHIYHMLMTSQGENRFDDEYGSKMWERDFDLGSIIGNWTQELEKSLHQTIVTSEPRIFPDFEIKVVVEKLSSDDNINQKQRFLVAISKMRLVNTNEKIDDVNYNIVFSPISIDS